MHTYAHLSTLNISTKIAHQKKSDRIRNPEIDVPQWFETSTSCKKTVGFANGKFVSQIA